MNFFSQKDPRWKNEKLGTCSDTLGQSSCFITALCNLALNLNTSDKTPSELNKWLIKKGGYSNGCLLNSAKGAEGVGLVLKEKTKIDPKHICICETDHYKSKGVPQHFFVYSDKMVLDSLDLKLEWKKNPYIIVSYRVFNVKAPKVPLSPENAPNEGITPVEPIPQEVDVVNNQPQEQIMQIQNSFDKVTLIKIGRGALIAGGGALAIYFLQAVIQMDFGTATPLIVALASIAINAIKEYKAGV